MGNSKRILILDFCNYDDYPMGGYLTFAKNLMVSFGNELVLVGISTDSNDPIGKWFKKNINGVFYDFFALAYYSKAKTKHILPDRLVSYFLIKYYQKAIMEINIQNIFIQRQEVLQAINDREIKNICYCFAGLENPLAISKYWYAQYAARFFEQKFFGCLKEANTILASGDENAIVEMIQRSNGRISRNLVVKFPSRINTDIFKPLDYKESRSKHGIPDSAHVVITTGRLARLKGWKFMIDCFSIYNKQVPDSLFYMVGEGEDLLKVKDYIIEKELSEKVILTGKKSTFDVAEYLSASDLFIMGSYKEGWSTSLIEAIACGIPACVTNFSSAKEIIIEGSNGFVIDKHNTEIFVKGMVNALELHRPVYNENVKAFSANRLKEDLVSNWKLL
jgi:glycosyltransferase involved in cell wall biosynthesis